MRGAVAGALAAAAWQACDPIFERAFGTPYSDSQLLGPFITRGRHEWAANLAMHAAGGAVFGHVFERLGGRTVKQGVVAALAENAILWPGIAVFDRIHPKRRDGTWPPLVTNARVFASASAGHAFFGALLGAALRDT